MSDFSDYEFLTKHRKVWKSKPILQRLYRDQYYQRLLDNMTTGENNLEIGSGPGFLQEIAPQIIRSDILLSPYINIQSDAHGLPFQDESLSNVIGLDVLHHFNQPMGVLKEVNRVLKKGGRFILVEPYITPFSRLIYTYLHQEACDLSVRPWDDNDVFDEGKVAFDGNAAIPYLLLTDGKSTLEDEISSLRLIKQEKFSLFTYLLSGGFKEYNFLPTRLYKFFHTIEEKTSMLWKDIAALRALIVWEKI